MRKPTDELKPCYRPKKKMLSIRLDTDLIDYYKAASGARGYQTMINAVLREFAALHTSTLDNGSSVRDLHTSSVGG